MYGIGRALTKSLCFFAIVLLVAGCDNSPTEASHKDIAVTSEQEQLEKITLLTDWYAEPEHGGFYLAYTRGYYREEGIDLTIRPITNGGSLLTLIATGQAEFGLGTSDNLAVAISRNIPLVAVFPYFQHDPQGVMFHEGSDIQSLSDLDGRNVMFNPALHYLEVIQRTLDIEINVIPLDYSVARFVGDQDFVQQAFLTSEPYFAIQAGAKPQLIPFWEVGLDPYRLAYSNRKFADENPDLVKAFVTASLRGWGDFMAGDTEAAFAYIKEQNPQQNDDFMAWTYQEMQGYQLAYGLEENGETLGQVDINRIGEQINLLNTLDLLDSPVDPEKLFFLDNYPSELILPAAQQESSPQ